jgi:hypothetical protein
VKRFLKVLSLLVVALMLLASGVDATLDQLSRTPAQSSFVWYNEKGDAVLAYCGDLAQCKSFSHPIPPAAPVFLHRT